MRVFLTNLTAVMLFAHAVLGCCSHHVHACGKSHGPVAFGGGTQDCWDTCGDHSSGHSGQTSHEHQGQDDCQGSTCDFGRPANERAAKSGYVFWPPAAVLPSEFTPDLAGGRLVHDPGTTGVLLPVRLHLAYQVLLI